VREQNCGDGRSASFGQPEAVTELNGNYEHTVPRIEMLVGRWFPDQFGNLTRQIKARD
jgi:hypothetical protein